MIKKVTIKLPLTKTERKSLYVSINGKSYLVPRGIWVPIEPIIMDLIKESGQVFLRKSYLEKAMSNFEALSPEERKEFSKWMKHPFFIQKPLPITKGKTLIFKRR